jgi:hypothetical protein
LSSTSGSKFSAKSGWFRGSRRYKQNEFERQQNKGSQDARKIQRPFICFVAARAHFSSQAQVITGMNDDIAGITIMAMGQNCQPFLSLLSFLLLLLLLCFPA